MTGIQEYGYIGSMKTTIDVPEDIYRKVKAKSAMEGRPVRDVVITLFQVWLDQPDTPAAGPAETPSQGDDQPSVPPWFGAVRHYAQNARGRYDMASIRRSISRGRSREDQTP